MRSPVVESIFATPSLCLRLAQRPVRPGARVSPSRPNQTSGEPVASLADDVQCDQTLKTNLET